MISSFWTFCQVLCSHIDLESCVGGSVHHSLHCRGLLLHDSDEHIVWWYIVIPNIVSFSKYRINIVIAFFLDNITRYLIMYYWSILAFHGPVKAKWLFKFLMVWHIAAWIGVIYAFVVHLKNDFLCIVWSYHEFHENVVIIATYAHILSKEKYRVISCDYRIKTQNIV